MAPGALTQTPPSPTPEQPPAPGFVFRSEFDLLLACCGDFSKSERAERVREILRHPFDWERLVHLAEHHGVTPHLYRQLSQMTGMVPSGPLDALRQRYEANARQTLWLARELLRVLGHLERRGIKALPYKGPVLAELLYGNVALRQFSDLDVLVHAEDIPRTKAAVMELGYRPGIHLTLRQERANHKSGYESTFDPPQGRNLLEIQWQIVPHFYVVDFDMDGLFDRAGSLSLGGHSLFTLCAEDLLLVLCVHAAKHAWVQVSWLCDVGTLARSQPLDWAAFQERAQRLRIARIVAVTFALAHRLLGSSPPATVQESMQRDHAVEALVERILPITARSEDYNPESISYFRLMVDLRERWQDRFHFFCRLVFTPSVGEWSAIRLPDALFPLYRVVRLVRLIARVVTPTRQRNGESTRS